MRKVVPVMKSVSGLATATTAFEVGYESATQFSREYRRLFGEPPRRDIDRLSSNSEASLGVT